MFKKLKYLGETFSTILLPTFLDFYLSSAQPNWSYELEEAKELPSGQVRTHFRMYFKNILCYTNIVKQWPLGDFAKDSHCVLKNM